ncbi:FIG01047955: hypothetical protein, partial [Salmonella enterica subsp. enterica serovar Rissen]
CWVTTGVTTPLRSNAGLYLIVPCCTAWRIILVRCWRIRPATSCTPLSSMSLTSRARC